MRDIFYFLSKDLRASYVKRDDLVTTLNKSCKTLITIFSPRSGRGYGVFSVLIFLSFIFLVAGCSSTETFTYQEKSLTKADLQTVNIDQVTGHWEGIYHTYPNLMGIKLELSTSGANTLSGELHFYPLIEKRGLGRIPPGSYSVTGSYDPVTRTLELNPVKWIDKPSTRVTALSLTGVYDNQKPAVAGFLGEQRNRRDHPIYFTLMLSDKAEKQLREPFLKSNEQVNLQASGVGSIFNSLVRDIPSDEKILQWASKFTDEYPEINPSRTEMGLLYTKAVNLFEDKHFIAHFGLPFEQMSPGQRDMVADRLQGSHRSLEDRSDYKLRDYRAFSRAFNTSGSPGTPGITSAMLAQRVIRSWNRTTQYRLANMAARPGNFRQIAEIENKAPMLRTLWPSEQRAFNTQIASTRERLASPILAASAKEAVNTSKGYSGARQLAGWERSNRELLQYVNPSEKQSLLSKIESKRDELLAPLIAAEIAKLRQIPNAASAVANGNDWYINFRNRYGFASQSKPYQQALGILQSRRAQDLSRVLAPYGEHLNKLTPEEKVDEFVSSVLVVPGDRNTNPGQKLYRMANIRKQTIDARRKLQYGAMFGLVAALLLQSDNGNSHQTTDEGPNCVAQGLGSFARDYFIRFSISAFWPNLNETTVLQTQQIISGFMDQDLSLSSGGKDLLLNQMIEMLGRNNPIIQDFPVLVELTSNVLDSCTS